MTDGNTPTDSPDAGDTTDTQDAVDLADETLADLGTEDDVTGGGGQTWTKYRDLGTACQTCMEKM